MAARRGGPGRWDDDDDDYAPVYKGNRNYDSVGAKVGEAFSDLAVSVRKVADRVLDDGGTNRGGRFDERRGSGSSNNAWGRARRAFSMGDDSPPRSQSSLPENCFCDMRGFACPRHRGREKWRQNHDYKIHVEHNVDSAASDAALGAGSTLAGSTFGKCLGSV
mmetsp:Transcript_1909/g.6274  ORF Transcript_1909/g.6274 Transcript_1909/m.6274 type:complete len:163 (+) Transcript_1909:35-523(+)